MRVQALGGMMSVVVFAASAHAEAEPVADFRLTDVDALGQIQGPAILRSSVGGTCVLTRVGTPRYMNIPPDPDDGRALGFDGTSSYLFKGDIRGIDDGFILEAWCRAANRDDGGLHGVAAVGDGGRGYSLVQQGSAWGVFVGGHGFVPAGPVKEEQWTHIALVMPAGGRGRVYLDGDRKADVPGSPAGIAPSFAIGDMGNGKECFSGDISRVRLSRHDATRFDATRDLLIDAATVEETARERTADARRRIASILGNVETRGSIKLLRHGGDWLVHRPGIASTFQVTVAPDGASARLVIGNGLITRTFHLGKNLVCFSLRQEPARMEFLRSIKPEATLTIDGRKVPVGGLRFPSMASGRKGRGRSKFVANYFLSEWLDELVDDPNAFKIASIDVSEPRAGLKWTPMSRAATAPWPPKGLRVSMRYDAPDALPGLAGLGVTVHYEIYDDLPTVGKWLSFENTGDRKVTLERTLIEELAFADDKADMVFVESEYNHFHAVPTRWHVDPEFRTDSGPVYTERMSDYRLRYWAQSELDDAAYFRDAANGPEWQGEYRSRSLMQVQYPHGPALTLAGGESWNTFRSWLLLHDSMSEERKGLGRRKLYRVIFPWAQENLVYMHVLSHKSDAIRKAVDQCAECGFDMIILTFGSRFNMMSRDPKYIARIKSDFDYAHRKGIKTGAYILFCSSRSYGNGEHDAKPPAYGRSLCLGSGFAEGYFKQLLEFMKAVGQDCIETDGPYHGYRCERTDHPLHKGVDDSWRVNWEQQEKFYRMCMDEGRYIITPDWYYAAGGRKMPMGYKESNWTLPRPQQALVARQNIYDGTWWRTPAMSYHALPLTPVYGGGADSTMEPLHQHLDAYDRVLGAYFGMGIMACYRGYRLYDTDETKAVVKGWVDFYRRHKPILDSDIIHVRRPDGRDLDCMMHVNSELIEKALAFIWNPTPDTISREFELPLYYTGLRDAARITVSTGFREAGKTSVRRLDRSCKVRVPVAIPAHGYVRVLVRAPR